MDINIPAEASLEYDGRRLERKSTLLYFGIPLSDTGAWEAAVEAKIMSAKEATRRLHRFLANKQIPVWVQLHGWAYSRIRTRSTATEQQTDGDVERVQRFAVKKILYANT